MKRTILFICNKEVSFLPPFMAILDSLCSNYNLKVISYEKEGGKKMLEDLYAGKDIEFLSHKTQNISTSIMERAKRRLRRIFKVPSAFHREAIALMEKTSYDLLWIIHEETAFEFRNDLIGKRYLLSFYELNDHRLDFLDKLKPVAKHALEVLVPEYNRACILRTWMKLDKTPIVIPNKPLAHPRQRKIDNEWSACLANKKILLYQGYLNSNRNIDAICKAIDSIPGWSIVFLGKGEKEYVTHLMDTFPNALHIEYVLPPSHLNITSWARIGVVKYDWYDLNHAYCAPNKTWEYAGFGIPMIGNDLPGLHYTIGKANAAVLADMDSVEEIKEAIIKIDNNYEYYSKNALSFYESCDIKSLLNDIARKEIKD